MISDRSRLLFAWGLGLSLAASSAPAMDFPTYDMTVTVGADQASLEVSGQLVVPPSPEPRHEIVLGLGEALVDLEVEVLEPAGLAGTRPSRGELISGHREGWGTYPWALRFETPLPAGRPLRLSFRCRGGQATAFVYHLGPPVSFAGGINTAWYPQVDDPRVEEAGWSGLRATGQVTFELPAGLVVYAAGHAPSSARQSVPFTFDFPVYFSFAVGPYRVLQARDGSPVAACFLSERENENEYVTGSAAVLEVLEATFGPYPHSRFGLVEVPWRSARAAGFAGASLDGFILATSSFLDRRFNTAYFGHEIGHQWWGNLVTTSGERGSMMLSEGMAQFGSLVAVETIDGQEAAEGYRRTGYPGYIPVQSGLGYLRLAAAGLDQPLPEANDGPVARILADGKGFQVWSMLADEVGRDRFFSALQQVVERHSLKPVAWDDFLDEMERTLDADLGWFRAQWFDGTGAPAPALEWAQEGNRVEVTILQGETPFRMTLDVDVISSAGVRETHRVEASGPRTTATLPASFEAGSVVLDPRYRVLRWTPEYRAEALALVPATKALAASWNGKRDEAESILRAALEEGAGDDRVDLYGRRFAMEAALGQMLIQADRPDEARTHLEAALRAPSRRAADLPWTYFHLGRVALALNDDTLLHEVRRSIVSADALAGGTGAPEALGGEIARH